MLRYRGEALSYTQPDRKYANTYVEPEVDRLTRIGLTWVPFKGMYDNLAGGQGKLENGHDHRYIGIASAVFGVIALLFGRNPPLGISLLMTFVLVNGFLVYTSENLLFSFMQTHSDVIATIRNTQTILPRGGASIMLILLSVLGVDTLMTKERRPSVQVSRVTVLGLAVLCSLGVIFSMLYINVFDPMNKGFLIHSGVHIGFYALIFSIAGFGLAVGRRKSYRTAWCAAIIILAVSDGVTSLSNRMGGELSVGNIWPHQWDARIPYDELEKRGMVLADDIKFNQFSRTADAMFPLSYRSGAYHNSTEINSAFQDWLSAYNVDQGRDVPH